MQTYLFYDIETTGLNKSFDQILQFAAIRTDQNLKELERYELRVKLNPDCIPAPKALITHHIGVNAMREGIAEIDAIKQIHQWMNTPGTISLGYNTLGFDDEFLRFSFYRNLLSPYTHQFANQCQRMDLYPMCVMYYLFKNQLMNWPQKSGAVSLKLEELNRANQLATGRAHDAMVDVEATLALANIFFKDQEMWKYLSSYFNKQMDQTRLNQLQNSEALMVDGIFGAEQNYQCVVFPLGTHKHYKNQTLWLRLDTENFREINSDNIKELTRVKSKKAGEPDFILPFSERFNKHLQTEKKELALANKKWLLEQPELLKKITEFHADFLFPVFPHADADASLYLNGFWSFDEEKFCQRFHAVQPKEKIKLMDVVKNPRLKTIATRILGRHYPEILTDSLREEFTNHLQKIHPEKEEQAMIDFRGEKRLTPNQALKEIKELRETEKLSTEQLQILAEYEAHLQSRT